MVASKSLFSFFMVLMVTQQKICGKDVVVKLITKCGNQNKMGNAISKHINNTVGKAMQNFYDLIEFDICDEIIGEGQFQLTRVLTSLLLSQEWRKDVEKNKNYYVVSPDWKTIKSSDEYRILGAITYLPDDLLQRTIEILRFSNIFVYPLTKTRAPEWFESQQNVFPATQNDQSTEAIIGSLLKKHRRWKNILIIELGTEKPELQIKDIRRHLRKRNIRYLASQPFINDGKIFGKIKNESNQELVIVIGPLAGKFIMDAYRKNITNKHWVIFAKFHGKVYPANKLPDYVCFKNVLGHQAVTTLQLFHNNTLCQTRKQKKIKKKQNMANRICGIRNKKLKTIIQIQMAQIIIHIQGSFQRRAYQIEQLRKNENRTIVTIPDLDGIVFPGLRSRIRKLEHEKFNINNSIEHCEHVKVKQLTYSKEFTKQWDYTCVRCKNISYLSDGYCYPCVESEIAFKNQSACYNPFQDPLRTSNVIDQVTTILDASGIVVCLFIVIVFVRYRHTPVVRSSHFALSITQVICCMILFVIFMSAVALEPDVLRCTSRQYVVSLLLIVVNAIVVCKSEKIITICCKKILLDKKAKRDLLMKQMLIFIFITLIDLIIIVSSFPNPSHPIKNVKRIDIDGNEYLTLSCDLGQKSYLQVLYCIVLLTLSIVQAMRGHGRLPDAYNEGNAIITSSATSICCLLFLMIYGSMSQVSIKQNDFVPIICITLSIYLMSLMLCLYAGKIYIMLFNKNRNTKSFINTFNKQMEYVVKHCESQRRKATRMSRMTSVTFIQSEALTSSVHNEEDDKFEPFYL